MYALMSESPNLMAGFSAAANPSKAHQDTPLHRCKTTSEIEALCARHKVLGETSKPEIAVSVPRGPEGEKVILRAWVLIT